MTDARRGNGFSPDETRLYVRQIETHLDELDGLATSHNEACAAVRADIKGVYEAAAEAGIPKRELKAVIRERVLRRKLDGCRTSLGDLERIETFDQIKLALGMLSDLPLGEAVLRAPAEGLRLKSAEEVAAENAAALRAGIKPTQPKTEGGEPLDDLADVADGRKLQEGR